jgi:hypothetical protein
MRRPKPFPPDTRPDWRDPAMPVCREYVMGDGSIRRLVDPAFEQSYRAHRLSLPQPIPDWRTDPTYNLRKPKP